MLWQLLLVVPSDYNPGLNDGEPLSVGSHSWLLCWMGGTLSHDRHVMPYYEGTMALPAVALRQLVFNHSKLIFVALLILLRKFFLSSFQWHTMRPTFHQAHR